MKATWRSVLAVSCVTFLGQVALAQFPREEFIREYIKTGGENVVLGSRERLVRDLSSIVDLSKRLKNGGF